MDFNLPERVRELQARVRQFVERELFPLEPELSKGFRALEPRLLALRKQVRELGLLAPHMPRSEGGAGLSLVEHGLLSEELGRSPIGHFVFNCQAPDAGNMEILHLFGSDAQKERWLKPLVAGEIRSCFSMTEPETPGSNPTWLESTAVLENGQWVINGHKWFTTSADGAAFAVVMAVTNPDAPPHLRASQIIVPLDTPGVKLVRNLPVMGESGEGWASHGELRYEDVRVPEENLLGGQGFGFAIAQERLGPGRIHHCMRWIGIAERAFDLLCKRAVERHLSPGKPLALKGTVQAWIADSRAEIDASRLMVLRAAWEIDQRGAKAARDYIATIKFFVANMLDRVLDRALQAHGALGVTDDTPLAWWYRHERAARIYDGPDEVHKESVAKRILRGYGLEGRK